MTEIFRRGGKVRQHAATGAIALLVSSLIPISQAWLETTQRDAELERIEQRLEKQIDDLKSDQKDRNKALWEALNRKADR